MNDLKPCTKCQGTDFTAGGKCRACQKARNLKYAAKKAAAAKSKGAKRAKKAKIKKAVAAVEPIALEIEQGYGLQASIDDAYLIIAQHDGETGKDDKVCISRHELRQLVAKFGPWAGIAAPC